jgi:hypothetical protein
MLFAITLVTQIRDNQQPCPVVACSNHTPQSSYNKYPPSLPSFYLHNRLHTAHFFIYSMDLSPEAIFILLGLLLLLLPFVLELGEVDAMVLFGVCLLVAARNVWVM